MSLKETFEEYADKDWVFAASGGNQGDEMIYQGAFKLADEAGLRYRHVKYKKRENVHILHADTVIYLQGGGGFNRWWKWTPILLRKLREANHANLIIVGPTTVAEDRDYLNAVLNMDGVIFFARERISFDVMQNYCTDVRLDHDTALHLRYGDGYLQRLVGTLEPRSKFSLLVLRKDMEVGHIPNSIMEEDFDRVVDPCWHKDWGRLHMHAKRIVANRSHSAIMGAILGKDTSLFAGSYHKNRSIWEYSLKDMGVKWIE